MTLASSHGVVIRELDVFARRTHAVTFRQGSSGNVLTASRAHYTGYPERMERLVRIAGDEVVRTHTWRMTSGGEARGTETAYEHWPQLFVVGVHRAGGKRLTMAGREEDRVTPFFTVQSLNAPYDEVPSLGAFQRERAGLP